MVKNGSDERWARPLSFTVDVAPEILAAWSGNGSSAPRVSRREALGVPAVKRVRDLICATIGGLPFQELTDPGNRIMFSELLKQPEADVPRSVTMTMTAEDMLFEQVAWWRILETDERGWPTKVRRLEARTVTVRQDQRVYYSPTGMPQGSSMEWIPDAELIRFDSPNPGLLTFNARTIRDAMALAAAASKNIQNPIPFGYITPTEEEDPDDPVDGDAIANQWQDAIARRAWPFLNAGVKVNTVEWTPEQLQFAASRDAVVLEIARMGGVDPEELAVSTTSRTYQNSEQRRLDLLDFTANAYLVAMEDRLTMDDVTYPGRKVRADRHGFLKSDTLTRMQTYEVGRRVGVYDDERIARIEEIPSAVPQAAPVAEAAQQPQGVQNMHQPRTAVGFSAPVAEAIRFGFDIPPETAGFAVSAAKRTITGMAIPWDMTARADGYMWSFAPGSLHYSAPSRVKMDMDHIHGSEFGAATAITTTDQGLQASFSVARGPRGDEALQLAEGGVYDGMSVWVTFDGEGDGWIPHPSNEQVRYVQSATLRKVALTAIPAFDDARVTAVAATRKDNPMPCTACGQQHAPGVACPTQAGGVALATAPPANLAPTGPVPVHNQGFDPVAFNQAFFAGFTPAMAAALAEALAPVIGALPMPNNGPGDRPVVPAGRRPLEVAEPMVYAMNGQGPSFVRDAWKSRTEGDHEARERITKFQRQTEDLVKDMMADPQFAINTGNASAVIPPGYRPDLYVTQLLKGRPLTNGVSRGTLTDATPFNIPAFVSSSGATADHVEGVNPSEGSLTVGTVTVVPQAISGLYKITREMADSANPAIDAIATLAMSENYSQQTEAKVYTELNGTNGVGGTITSGFVPSGAQVTTTNGQGDELGLGIRTALGVYSFNRFAEPDSGYFSREATTEIASAVDTTGRPLFPWVAPMNPLGGASRGGYFIDGLQFEKAWSMTGNASSDADVIGFNRNDVWAWESPTLMFRFEERSGPTFVELALFGYFATRVLRGVGLFGIRHTHV